MSKQAVILLLLAMGIPLAILWAAASGAMHIDWTVVWAEIGQNKAESAETTVFWHIRLPRILMALLVGSVLAFCGTSMQALFRNPLADPSIIGISGGAVLAAALGIVLLDSLTMPTGGLFSLSILSLITFGGALCTAIVIFRLGRNKGKTEVATMLLAGIALNALAGAFTGLLIYLADDAQLRSITFWTLGSLAGSSWIQVGIMGLFTGLAYFFLRRHRKSFNALALGEEEAAHLGFSNEKIKGEVIIWTALGVGVSVAFCGMIGFIGLVVPHILRLLAGSDHHFLFPASALSGALILLLADTFARTIVSPAELPIGIITSLIGAPVFLYMLIQQKRRT